MIKTEPIIYRVGDDVFEGLICWDDALKAKKPGVLVVHTFKGQGEFENSKAVELAKLGYVGFAVDMYGQGRRADEPERARVLMNELNGERALLQKRILAALETLKAQTQVDETRTGAIGFCFGGKCVLDLARSGADVRGVASFHGIYDRPPFETAAEIRSSILVLHGWGDPLCPPSATVALAAELNAAKADWQILAFGQTGHAFTNPQANAPAQGLYFQENSNRRAWEAMKRFFEELF